MGGVNSKKINVILKIWRQKNSKETGGFVEYKATDISTEASFLEMLDVVNERLIQKNEDPIAFDHDCREGICGSCGFMVSGNAHGPMKNTTVCQLHMRVFSDGEIITIEPFRAKAFPLVKDLMVDRSSLDRIITAGGFISVDTGNAQDANSILISKPNADEAFESATCIGCGACVASCKNASAMLFTGAKISHLALLPQGQVERMERVEKMVAQMDSEGFGACTSTGVCSASCPKGISLSNIARLNKELLASAIAKKEGSASDGI